MSTFSCRNCGKELSGNWLYCTGACQQEYEKKLKQLLKPEPLPKLRSRNKYTKRRCICEMCKIEFRGRYGAKTCSSACRQKMYRRDKERLDRG